MSTQLHNSKSTRAKLGGISTTTLWRYVKSGKLHEPIKPTPRTTLWKEEWIEAFANSL